MRITLSLLAMISLVGMPAFAQGSEDTSERQYIPYIVEGAGWRTFMTFRNVCDEAKDFRIEFFDSNGEPWPLVVNGENDNSHFDTTEAYYGEDVPPVAPNSFLNWGFSPRGGPRSVTDPAEIGYGIFADDAGGCITGSANYFDSQEEPQNGGTIHKYGYMGDSWAVRLVKHEWTGGCQSTYAITSDGSPVSLEVYNRLGTLLTTADLGNVYLKTFSVSDYFSNDVLYWEEGREAIGGTLVVKGRSIVTGFFFCRGQLYANPVVSYEINK